MSKPTYALYKGDRLLGVGTLQELAERRGVKPETIYYYSMPAYRRRGKANGNRLVAVRVAEGSMA
jgi:hypothetical protein